MTLKSLDVDKRSYKKIFKVFEKIFWPEANDMNESLLGFIQSTKSKASLLTLSLLISI